MKIKREGGEWSWVQFKYERLSTFCFVCGMLGHSDRDCAIMYAHPDKEISRAYGTWLRAPMRGAKNQNLGAKWLRNSTEGEGSWMKPSMATPSAERGKDKVEPKFMEVDGIITEVPGNDSTLNFFILFYQNMVY